MLLIFLLSSPISFPYLGNSASTNFGCLFSLRPTRTTRVTHGARSALWQTQFFTAVATPARTMPLCTTSTPMLSSRELQCMWRTRSAGATSCLRCRPTTTPATVFRLRTHSRTRLSTPVHRSIPKLDRAHTRTMPSTALPKLYPCGSATSTFIST